MEHITINAGGELLSSAFGTIELLGGKITYTGYGSAFNGNVQKLTLGAGNSRVSVSNLAMADFVRADNGTASVNLGMGWSGWAVGTGTGTVAASSLPFFIVIDPQGGRTDFAFNQGGSGNGRGIRGLGYAEYQKTLTDQDAGRTDQANFDLATVSTISKNVEVGTLRLGGGSGVTGQGTLTVNTNSNGNANASAILAVGSNSISVNTLAFNAKEGIFHVPDSSNLSVSSRITGNGGLTKSGAGTMVISGQNSGLVGQISINRGTVRLVSRNALGGDNPLQVTEEGTVDLQADQTFSNLSDGTGASQATGSTLHGGVITSTYGRWLTIDGTTDSSFSGAITGNASLIKSGIGTLRFSGSNTSISPTNISAGTLAIVARGTIAGSSGIYTAHGATLDVTATEQPFGLQLRQTLSGGGRVRGSLGGAGSIAPGPGQQVLTMDSLRLGDGLDFRFAFNQLGSPNYVNAIASGNDLVRLIDERPFESAFTSKNSLTLDVSALANVLDVGSVIRGGFFSPTDFADDLAGATFTFVGAPAWIPSFSVQVVPEIAQFEDGSANGFTMEIRAVPQPSTSLTVLSTAAAILGLRWRPIARSQSR